MTGRPALATAIAFAVLAVSPPASAEPRPAHLRPTPNTDEDSLWTAMNRAETQARQSAELNPDPALTAHMRAIACKVATQYCDDLRFYVMDRPEFNATAAPNGYVEVWSGLLLRIETDDQLAFVLGHEISHFAENHALTEWRATKSRQTTAMVLSIGVGLIGAGAAASATTPQAHNSAIQAADSVSEVIYFAAVAAYFRFSRAEEAEADRLGLERAAAAGFDPAAAAQVWRNLIAENSASDFPAVRKQQARASAFADHPIDAERVAALDALAPTPARTRPQDLQAYRAVVRPFLAAWLRDDLRRRDFGGSIALTSRLAAEGEDLGVINFYRGEAYRLRRGAGDDVQARAAYVTASAYGDAPAELWRNLGDLDARAGDRTGAATAYDVYLARAPHAEDRWLVENAAKRLNSGAGT